MTEAPQPAKSPPKWRAWLGWLASIGLAVIVVCSGCFMLFALALTAQGELEVSALGSDWRVWPLQAKGTNGIGVAQTYAYTSDAGQACRATTNWLLTWRPALQVEKIDEVSCEASVGQARVAPARRLTIIALSGGRAWRWASRAMFRSSS